MSVCTHSGHSSSGESTFAYEISTRLDRFGKSSLSDDQPKQCSSDHRELFHALLYLGEAMITTTWSLSTYCTRSL
jgi:hypothetical protein